jgi:hypothetical protein
VAEVKRNYAGIREAARNSPNGGVRPWITRPFFSVTPAQRRQLMEDAWKNGDLAFLGTFADLLTNEEAHEFRCGRQFAAWLGLTPGQYSSGGKTRLGHISGTGTCLDSVDTRLLFLHLPEGHRRQVAKRRLRRARRTVSPRPRLKPRVC